MRLFISKAFDFGCRYGRRRTYTARAYIQQLGREPLIYRNLAENFQIAVEKFAKRTALICVEEQTQLTYEQAYEEAATLALRLHDLGLRRGDHLGIWAPNTKHWFVTCLAAAVGGFTLVCLNPAWQARELAYALEKAKVQALITQDLYGQLDFYGKLKQILTHEPQLKAMQRIIVQRTSYDASVWPQQFLDYATLCTGRRLASKDMQLLQADLVSPESPCNIQFTSGTTGQPKAALLTHFGLINQCRQFGRTLNLHTAPKRVCVTVPFFHVFGLSVLLAALQYGATLVLPSATFNAQQALASIAREHCQVLVGTPTMYVDLLEQQQRLQHAVYSLETAIVGGATCSPQLCSAVKASFGLEDMRIGYGMSEATAAVMATDSKVEWQSVGKLYEHGEAKVIDADGETVPFGVPGELCLRGYFTMLGYYDDAAKTSETLGLDGWLRTGDEFVLEENGLARIVGRKRDIIIRGGENIFPKEIEDFLETHNDVLEAQIVGVPDKRLGEEICAYLRLRSTSKGLTLEDIKAYCAGQLAYYKIPRYLRIVEDFPKTATGKIQKFKLIEIFKANSV